MLRLKTKLEDLERDKNPICMGVVGAGETDTGQKGSTLIEQIERVPGITTLIVVDSSINEAVSAFRESGIPERKIEITESPGQASKAIAEGRRVATQNLT